MLAVGPFGLGLPELIIILVVVMLIFGVGKMADIGGALGKSIREFRRSAKEPEEPGQPEQPALTKSASAGAPDTAGRHCTSCGEGLADEMKFCAKCGAPVQAAVN